LLEVGRMLCVLESLALPYAAVYHTGEMHCHGEGMVDVRGCGCGYMCVCVCVCVCGSRQWLRNREGWGEGEGVSE